MGTYVFDLDGTLCTHIKNGDYKSARPLQDRIEKVNKLFDNGHEIIILTARGMGRTGNNIEVSYKLFYDLTKNQLKHWGIKYDQLLLGKPSGDFYIDDKGVNADVFFSDKS